MSGSKPRTRIPKRLLLATVAALAVAGVVVLIGVGVVTAPDLAERAQARDAAGGAGQRTSLVRVRDATLTPFIDTVEAVGTARARQSVDIVALSAGRVAEVAFRAGDRVKAGDLLLQLDDETERADLREAEAALEEAANTFERTRRLVESNVATPAALEQTESAHRRAQAVVDRARKALNERQVQAPFSGIVSMPKIEAGSRIDTNTTIATLDDIEAVEVEFSLPEVYLSRVSAGQTVRSRSITYRDHVFEGYVTEIDSRVNPLSRAFAVRASIPNEGRALRAGMFLSIELLIEERLSVSVPEEAIVTQADGTFVYMLTDDRAQKQRVALGDRGNGLVEINDGIDAGQPVIVSGIQAVRDGVAVSVLDREDASNGGMGQ